MAISMHDSICNELKSEGNAVDKGVSGDVHESEVISPFAWSKPLTVTCFECILFHLVVPSL